MKNLALVVAVSSIVWSAKSESLIVEKADRQLREQATATIEKAAAYFRNKIARHGGYVYHYSIDLKQRWGEGLATEDQIWVQPPGTPTVGMAFLRAYEATGNKSYLEAATEATEALVYGQLSTGGWTNSVDLKGRKEGYQYWGGKRRREGFTSLDDGQSQSAIRLMIQVDKALEFKHRAIHDSASMALDTLLKAQFANGGFPQGWKGPVSKQPILKASYPQYEWRTEGRIKNYWDMYTLNDNVCGYVTDALIDAYEIYGDAKYLTAIERLGDFYILAQMPDPQPAWAQQYNYEMKPIWARRFEPPGISGDESQEAIETLMKIARITGDRKYLKPIPSALAYLKRSLLPEGKLARYYELETNRPLYMSRRGKNYSLTYDDSKLPKHYGWKTESRLDELEAEYQRMKDDLKKSTGERSVAELAGDVRKIIGELDDEGRWVSVHGGERLVGQAKFPLNARYIATDVFSRNVETLSEYLKVTAEN